MGELYLFWGAIVPAALPRFSAFLWILRGVKVKNYHQISHWFQLVLPFAKPPLSVSDRWLLLILLLVLLRLIATGLLSVVQPNYPSACSVRLQGPDHTQPCSSGWDAYAVRGGQSQEAVQLINRLLHPIQQGIDSQETPEDDRCSSTWLLLLRIMIPALLKASESRFKFVPSLIDNLWKLNESFIKTCYRLRHQVEVHQLLHLHVHIFLLFFSLVFHNL